MSRLVAMSFLVCDVITTAASIFTSIGGIMIVIVSLVMSALFAMTASMVQSMFWPTYACDEADGQGRA